MLPNFQVLSGAPWRILPPGEHIATLQEIKQSLAFNHHRLNLFNGLVSAARLLAQSGCKYLYLDTPLSTLYNSLILKGLKFNSFLAKNCKPSIYRALEKRVESQVLYTYFKVKLSKFLIVNLSIK